ncbi:MAG: TM2 domain-containing protein [Pseudomonadota bacterium]
MNSVHKELVFESNRKSKGIAYLLWLLAGWAGAHRFYAGEMKTGAIQLVLALSIIGWVVLPFWLLLDLFFIPGMINERNLELLHALNSEREGSVALEEGDWDEDRQPPLDSKRARMLEDLRSTGYRKERRDLSSLYR